MHLYIVFVFNILMKAVDFKGLKTAFEIEFDLFMRSQILGLYIHVNVHLLKNSVRIVN